jgi:hypothetical protein
MNGIPSRDYRIQEFVGHMMTGKSEWAGHVSTIDAILILTRMIIHSFVTYSAEFSCSSGEKGGDCAYLIRIRSPVTGTRYCRQIKHIHTLFSVYQPTSVKLIKTTTPK